MTLELRYKGKLLFLSRGNEQLVFITSQECGLLVLKG